MKAAAKIKTLKEILKIVSLAKHKGLAVVTTNGVFDLLHVGHVRNLEAAKSLGDMLIIGMNSDRSTRLNKGKGRPLVPQRERAEMVAALGSVDYVFIFGSKTPIPWLKKLRPAIHAKGGDRRLDQIVEREALKEIGARLVLVHFTKGKSTTNLIQAAEFEGNRRARSRRQRPI